MHDGGKTCGRWIKWSTSRCIEISKGGLQILRYANYAVSKICFSESFRLHQCCWQILETICVGDNYKKLVMILALDDLDHYLWTIQSPIKRHQHHVVTNITINIIALIQFSAAKRWPFGSRWFSVRFPASKIFNSKSTTIIFESKILMI